MGNYLLMCFKSNVFFLGLASNEKEFVLSPCILHRTVYIELKIIKSMFLNIDNKNEILKA